MDKAIEKKRSSTFSLIFSVTKFIILLFIIAQFTYFLGNCWKQIQPLYKKEIFYPYLTKDNDIIITTFSIAYEIKFIDNRLNDYRLNYHSLKSDIDFNIFSMESDLINNYIKLLSLGTKNINKKNKLFRDILINIIRKYFIINSTSKLSVPVLGNGKNNIINYAHEKYASKRENIKFSNNEVDNFLLSELKIFILNDNNITMEFNGWVINVKYELYKLLTKRKDGGLYYEEEFEFLKRFS